MFANYALVLLNSFVDMLLMISPIIVNILMILTSKISNVKSSHETNIQSEKQFVEHQEEYFYDHRHMGYDTLIQIPPFCKTQKILPITNEYIDDFFIFNEQISDKMFKFTISMFVIILLIV